MAEFLTIAEIRNYSLSNGTTVDLVALIDNMSPTNRWRAPVMEELAVGQVAYVDAMGEMRRGVITKLGRTKVHVTFTTQGAIDHQARYQSSAGIRVQTTAASAESIRVAPLAVPAAIEEQEELESPEETAEREAEREEQEGTLSPEEEAEFLAEIRITETEQAELDEMLAEWEGEGGALTPEPAPAPVLAPVTGSAIVSVLEEVWAEIRKNHPELPHVVIVTGSGFVGSPRWAHWRESGWVEAHEGHGHATRHGEMFVAGETLAKGAKHTVESMLHEGAHAWATEAEIQDTSRQGRWHNKEFRKLGEKLGLEYTSPNANPLHGYSFMTMTEETEAQYAGLIAKLDTAIRATIKMPAFVTTGGNEGEAGGEFVHGGRRPKTGGSSSTTNNLKLTCGCEKPNIIRASKAVATKMVIRCDECEELFLDRS